MHARLRRPAVALLATTLAAGALAAAPAAHAADGTVSGVVSGAGLGPIEDVDVELYQLDEAGRWSPVAWAVTDEEGAYSITAPEGPYRVGFDPRASDADVAWEFLGEAATVETGSTVDLTEAGLAVNAELPPAGHITGVVTDPDGTPVPAPVIALMDAPGSNVGDEVWSDFFEGGQAGTQPPDGAYDIGHLRAGTYRVGFVPVFAGAFGFEWYSDQATPYSGQQVVVAEGQRVAGVDAQFAPQATIAGRVTDADGEPARGVEVTALAKSSSGWRPAFGTTTNADGEYVIPWLSAATYRVRFDQHPGSDAPPRVPGIAVAQTVTEYWQDKGLLANATNLTVAAGDEVDGIDAQLVPGEHAGERMRVVQNTALPTVTGAPVVGSTLTASSGSWTPAPVGYSYAWMRNDQLIPGAVGATYAPTAADVGATLSVVVTAFEDDSESASARSAATATVTGPAVTAPTPEPTVDAKAELAKILKGLDLAGKPKVGKTVRLKGLDASFRTTVKYKIQWYAGAKKIKKATKSKLKITKAMKGKKIAVKVTATASGAKATRKLILGKAR